MASGSLGHLPTMGSSKPEVYMPMLPGSCEEESKVFLAPWENLSVKQPQMTKKAGNGGNLTDLLGNSE